MTLRALDEVEDLEYKEAIPVVPPFLAFLIRKEKGGTVSL